MGRRNLDAFEINFHRLSNGKHEFDFDIDENFFNSFEDSLIEEGKGKAFLTLEKSESMLQLHFKLVVKLQLICDVSLKPFTYPIEIEPRLIIKFGEEREELSEDVFVIHHHDVSVNVASFIHESISLEVPYKKIHPELEEQDRPNIAYSDEPVSDGESAEESIDPRWEVLKNLKK